MGNLKGQHTHNVFLFLLLGAKTLKTHCSGIQESLHVWEYETLYLCQAFTWIYISLPGPLLYQDLEHCMAILCVHRKGVGSVWTGEDPRVHSKSIPGQRLPAAMETGLNTHVDRVYRLTLGCIQTNSGLCSLRRRGKKERDRKTIWRNNSRKLPKCD